MKESFSKPISRELNKRTSLKETGYTISMKMFEWSSNKIGITRKGLKKPIFDRIAYRYGEAVGSILPCRYVNRSLHEHLHLRPLGMHHICTILCTHLYYGMYIYA